MSRSISFKFKYVNEHGNEEGFFAKKGRFTEEALTLDRREIPLPAITKAMRRFDRLILQILVGDQGKTQLVCVAVKGKALVPLLESINRITSMFWAGARREALEKEGRGAEFRFEECPYCHSMIDLSDFEPTVESYCRFCETIVKSDGSALPKQQDLNTCDQCGYYATPREFGTFYFYFLLVVYGYSYGKKYLCGACCRGEAWKMFFANFLFVLGLPFAVIQLFRVYLRDRNFGGGTYNGLDAANLQASKGKAQAALEAYDRLIRDNGDTAGLRYNRGLALAQANQLEPAAGEFEQAFGLCSNYLPALEPLAHCYGATGQEDKLKALERDWGGEDEAPPEGSEAPPSV